MNADINEMFKKIQKQPNRFIDEKSFKNLMLFYAGYRFYMHDNNIHFGNLPGFQAYINGVYNSKGKHWSDVIKAFSASDEEAFDVFFAHLDEYYLLPEYKRNSIYDFFEIFYSMIMLFPFSSLRNTMEKSMSEHPGSSFIDTDTYYEFQKHMTRKYNDTQNRKWDEILSSIYDDSTAKKVLISDFDDFLKNRY